MLECRDLSYRYQDGTIALENIQFSTTKGKIIGVIGSNGAGKSTLFKCMTGLLKPTSGRIMLNEQAITYNQKYLNHLRQQVNFVMQDPEKQIFFPRVYDDVAFGPRNIKLSDIEISRRVNMAMEWTNLQPICEKPVHFLSYGQKKRVAIAGVLALEPSIIIFDEPEAGLDPEMKLRMFEILRDLSEKGKTIIIASHNMDLIHQLTDYVVVLKSGRVLAEGETQRVLNDALIMNEAGLDIPFVMRLANMLGERSIKTENDLLKYLEGLK